MKVITFDIEEWYIEKKYHGGRIEKYKEFDRILGRILDKLDERQIKGTFFCLGKLATDFSYVIKQISERGHEIGCHSNEHLWLTKMTPKELYKDTSMAISALEDVCGKKVISYRAPAFSIGEKNKWAIDVLAECGIKRDASIFPAKRDFGGFSSFVSNTPELIEYNGTIMKEFPISTVNLWGYSMVYSGGGYFRLFPYKIINHLINHNNYVMTYFHIGDLIQEPKKIMSKDEYEEYFREKGTLINRYKRYIKSNLGKGNAFEKMCQLIDNFQMINLDVLDNSILWQERKPIIL